MAKRLGPISRRGLVIGVVALAAASGTAGALTSSSRATGKSAANAVAGPRRVLSRDAGLVPASKFPNHRASLLAPTGTTTSYAAFGITMKSGTPLLVPVLSAAGAVTSFAEQGLPRSVLGGLLTTATPSVGYEIVTENEPVYPGLSPGSTYPAWVVTYHHTPPQVYGPGQLPDPAALDCDFVGILDLDNQAWTDFFQSCD